jgi:hypothetical protein
MAPITSVPVNVHRAPNLSHAGPQSKRTNRVAQSAMMLELAISVLVMWRSLPMVSLRSGGYHMLEILNRAVRSGALTKAYHDQKATKNPNQLKKNTRPYMLTTLKNGIDRALWLMGLTSGASNNRLGLNILASYHIRVVYNIPMCRPWLVVEPWKCIEGRKSLAVSR